MLIALPRASWCLGNSTNLEAHWSNFSKGNTTHGITGEYPFIQCFKQTAKKYNIPLPLLLAVARGESDFQTKAKSKKSCYGIMQIQWPGTAGDLGISSLKELLKPCRNIDAGGNYLRQMLNRYNNNIHLALAAYNYGPGRITPGARKIPKGAQWYSGYIYDHLQYILATGSQQVTPPSYTDLLKEQIIIFNKSVLAENFLTLLRNKIPEMQFSAFHMGLGRFQVTMLYKDQQQLSKGRRFIKQRIGL
jgi:membrane-bound lytic murein transglycosylase MltF